MNEIEAQKSIDECRRQLILADELSKLTPEVSRAIGHLILAIDQLAVVVEDLAQREQGKIIA